MTSRYGGLLFLATLVVATVAYLLARPAPPERDSSRSTPQERRFAEEPTEVRLRPRDSVISIPSNHLWFIHSNRVGRGWPENEAFVDQMWDRVEVRFLLPAFQVRTLSNEALFQTKGSRDVLSIVVAEPMGADGDVRKKWNIVSHNLPAGPARQALDAAIAGGATKIAKLRHVEGVGLDEYPWSDEFQTTFFVSGASIFACERRPWLSDYAHPCRASLSFGQGLVATYTFSIEHLAEWKEIEAHARRVTASYLSSAPGSAR